jgi:hypothetical protein
LKGKKTEPNRTEINWFELVFGSVGFTKLKKKFSLVVYFGSKPDRTGNAQPYCCKSLIFNLIASKKISAIASK